MLQSLPIRTIAIVEGLDENQLQAEHTRVAHARRILELTAGARAAHDRIPVLVFDESAANVGGEMGNATGARSDQNCSRIAPGSRAWTGSVAGPSTRPAVAPHQGAEPNRLG